MKPDFPFFVVVYALHVDGTAVPSIPRVQPSTRAAPLNTRLHSTAEHSNALSLSAKKIINLEQSIKACTNSLSLVFLHFTVLRTVASRLLARMITFFFDFLLLA